MVARDPVLRELGLEPGVKPEPGLELGVKPEPGLEPTPDAKPKVRKCLISFLSQCVIMKCNTIKGAFIMTSYKKREGLVSRGSFINDVSQLGGEGVS